MSHQPAYFPWTDFFLRMSLADVFVFLDTVQYGRRTFQNRNKIKTRDGAKWLSVPLQYAPRDEIIMNMKIDNSKDWKNSHLGAIKDSYKSALFFEETLSLIEPMYSKEKWEYLSEFNCLCTITIARALGINTRFIKSSEIDLSGKGSDLILNICLKSGAANYISGMGGKSYLKEQAFKNHGINILYLAPYQLAYTQEYPEPGFIPNLSIIDYLFNNGIGQFKVLVSRYAGSALEKVNIGK